MDAVILVSNRLDPENEGEEVWLKNADKLLTLLDKDVKLGVYECPKPYKKLLTPRMLDWCLESGRFRFIKDTCCDYELIAERVKQLAGSELMLFNANGQTLYRSVLSGAAGYSGIIANYCPSLFVWLWENFQKEPERAEALSDMLSMLSFTEDAAYPITAKYFLKEQGLRITTESRATAPDKFGAYQKNYVEQMARVIEKLKSEYIR